MKISEAAFRYVFVYGILSGGKTAVKTVCSPRGANERTSRGQMTLTSILLLKKYSMVTKNVGDIQKVYLKLYYYTRIIHSLADEPPIGDIINMRRHYRFVRPPLASLTTWPVVKLIVAFRKDRVGTFEYSEGRGPAEGFRHPLCDGPFQLQGNYFQNICRTNLIWPSF